MRPLLKCVVATLLATGVAHAQIEIPGLPPASAGTDGDLVTAKTTIDLSQAVTGSWDQPGDGKGVYDPGKWAVVFKYSSVTVNNAYQYYLNFTNHPSRAPVVWLVSGNVTINGPVYLDGAGTQGSAAFAEPGPGGFRGGRGQLGDTLGSAGFGPGGGDLFMDLGSSAGSHATAGETYNIPPAPTYGNVFVLPVVGGSGGATFQGAPSRGGGAGGGAILIVATGTVTINPGSQSNGGIYARGGNGGTGYNAGSPGGSGGSIRLIANVVQGSGALRATGGYGYFARDQAGDGRVFVQANANSLTDAGDPAMVKTDFADSPYYIWPPEAGDPVPPEHVAPRIWPVKLVVDGTDVAIPDDPKAKLDFPLTDVSFDTHDPVALHISATNMPTDWIVKARIVAKEGDSFTTDAATLVSGDATASNWVVSNVQLPRGFGAIQVRAYKLPAQR